MTNTTSQSFDPSINQDVATVSRMLRRVMECVGQQVVGQEQMRRRLVQSLITNSHVLIEGVPGLAKTLAVKSLALAVRASFQRIQFTPDLLPADLLGTEIFRPREGTFEVRKGPVFANFVLADEINRAPAKVQSALLETMQEYQVTIGAASYAVPQPFFVLATQNPIEQEGTYPLPEAQVDRFAVKVLIDYPTLEEEKQILSLVTASSYSATNIEPAATLEEISHAQGVCKRIYVDDRVRDYILKVVAATRHPEQYGLKIKPLIEMGASPRASICLLQMARAEALMEGEYFVIPQNVKDVAMDVLRHRIVPSYEAEAQGLNADSLVRMILDAIEVP